ncbi:hypothetical protein GALL_117880 [mine drainage metagenome]|uniref:Helicase ATP-binding domain-containing protein n=1 Tax=mine drainage metagenome TaxID=410659 RepID=A0A1J5SCA6_9ZZZZ
MVPDKKMMQWVRLNKGNAVMLKIEMPDASFVIGVDGLRPADPEWQKLVSILNFRPSASGRLLLRAGVVVLREIREVFPNVKVDENYPVDQIFVMRSKVVNRAVIPDTQASILIGKNYLGQDVFVTATGARYIAGKDGTPVSEESISVAPAFLRAKAEGDIDLCADGFVLRMLGENLRPEDLRKFCAIIHGEDEPVEETDGRLREVQEAVEAAILRNILREFAEHGDIKRSYARASMLLGHQPTFAFRTSQSIALQQYSTPSTLSLAVQNILGDVNGLNLLEPTIGNASLVSLLRGANITGIEIDENRVRRTRKMLSETDTFGESKIAVHHADFTESDVIPDGYDVIVSNPPFGGLDKPYVKGGMKVTRIDQEIVLKSLDSRKANGKSVFIISADHDNIFKEKEGMVLDGSKNLFNWLSDHYELQAFEVSGNLYKKQGAGYPVRVLIVGRKRTQAEAEDARKTKKYRIDKLPVVKSHDELWAQSEVMKSFLAQSVPLLAENDASNKLADNTKQDVLNTPADTTSEESTIFGNEYQAQYEPMSSGETTAMIPKNLVVPQSIAFNRFIEENGDAEDFVRAELEIDDLEAVAPGAPEQIDAIALAIWNMKRGRALILADQTGMGKGRVLAAAARWSVLNNRPVIFLTEKASLFSDFWRDVRDIGSESVFTPFILNEDTDILSTDGDSKQEVLIPRTSKATRKRVIDSGGSLADEGFNLMMATYSQFNRDESSSAKARFIKDVSAGAMIILDESHNAAGDSNTGRNIAQAVQMSHAAVYSSATFSKDATNMGVYYKAFPTTVDMATLTSTLRAGGEPLQEVLSSMLCEDGVLVRREHDLSNLKFSTIPISDEILKRNIRVSDQVSDVLSMMAYLSGDIEKIAKTENKKVAEAMKNMSNEVREGKRMGVSYTNFGSRLYTISRQVALTLTMDSVINDALEGLKEGKKPVIVLEQTMESIMSSQRDLEADPLEEFALGAVAQQRLTINGLLHRVLDKLTVVNRNNGYGVVEQVNAYTISEDKNQRKALSEFIEAIETKIDAIEHMTIMPLDQIRAALRKEGYTSGEVSGRSAIYHFNEDGTVQKEERKNDTATKLAEIFRFNSGEHDEVVVTRSGCTGISMHASSKFADRRQRRLIEAQIANNVAERVQFFGRVNRRGQVSSPEIRSATSGMPWENRLLAMQNMKMRKLTANVQSNRNSAAEMKGIPDILNEVGELVCKEFLSTNPEIMIRLAIDPDGSENSQAEFYFANKLTGRMSLLPYVEQVRIYDELTKEYQRVFADLTNKGINPLESRLLDVKAEVVKRYEILPGVEGGSALDAPVFAEKIEWIEKIDPIRSAGVVELVGKSIERLVASEKSLFKLHTGSVRHDFMSRREVKGFSVIDCSAIVKKARQLYTEAMIKSVPERFTNPDSPMDGVAAALADKDMNAVKRVNSRMTWFSAHVEHLMPGDVIEVTVDDEKTRAVITHLLPPEEGKEHHLGQWEIRVLPVGAQYPVIMSYNSLIEDENYAPLRDSHKAVVREFDAAPAGELTFSKWTLTGNLFRASEMAATSHVGRAGIYTTKDGARHRAILCRARVDLDSLMTMEVALSSADALEFIETLIADEREGSVSLANDIKLSWRGHGAQMTISTPGTKMGGGQVFLNEKLLKFTGEFSGSRKVMTATFERPRRMTNFIEAIYDTGCTFKMKVENVKRAADDSKSGAVQINRKFGT